MCQYTKRKKQKQLQKNKDLFQIPQLYNKYAHEKHTRRGHKDKIEYKHELNLL